MEKFLANFERPEKIWRKFLKFKIFWNFLKSFKQTVKSIIRYFNGRPPPEPPSHLGIWVSVDMKNSNSMIKFVWIATYLFVWFYNFNIKIYSEFTLSCSFRKVQLLQSSKVYARSRLHLALKSLQIHNRFCLDSLKLLKLKTSFSNKCDYWIWNALTLVQILTNIRSWTDFLARMYINYL